jgi:putative Mn2+ efflux pump MntP
VKFIHNTFRLGHFVISLLFVICALALISFATIHLWDGLFPFSGLSLAQRLNDVLESIALLTVAVAALELGQTIIEEEVQREAQMSTPTRVRRFLSRFMIVLVVSLSIEALVIVFRVSQEAPEQLPYAASIGLMAAALLTAWGVFVRLNRSAEELEPEAMEEAKKEDEKVGQGGES